jgi:hypothetical protein
VNGWAYGRLEQRAGVSVREYRELEAGTRFPTFETWNRICKLYGWPQGVAMKIKSPESLPCNR